MTLPGWISKYFQKPPSEYKKLTVKNAQLDETGMLTVLLQHPDICMFTKAIVDYFKAAGGVNFVSFCAWDRDVGELEFIIRPKTGKPMAKIIQELKAEIKELKKEKPMDKIDIEYMRKNILRQRGRGQIPSDDCPFRHNNPRAGRVGYCNFCKWLFPEWEQGPINPHPCTKFSSEFIIERINEKLNIGHHLQPGAKYEN